MKVAYELSCAIQHLQSFKLLHRDIKTPNICLTYNWDIKLIDFSFSSNYIYDIDLMRYECGTAEFMAPEVQMGIVQDMKNSGGIGGGIEGEIEGEIEEGFQKTDVFRF